MKMLVPLNRLRRRHNISSYLLTISFITFATLLYFEFEDFTCLLRRPLTAARLHLNNNEKEKEKGKVDYDNQMDLPFTIQKTNSSSSSSSSSSCDIFAGRWVYDEMARPFYAEQDCPYIQPQLTCQAHGRPDTGYQHWTWQPHACSLPSFNATLMWEMLRGKRMMYVGDSLNRGQFVSMVCLLHRVLPDNAKSWETFNGDSLTVFTAKEYNASIEFYWAPFLVESNSDNAVIHRITDRIVRAGSINKHAKHWKGVDILVFNTYLWWMTGQKMKILRGSFESEMRDITEMETEDAYRLALGRLVRWLEKNVDPDRTRVFFATMSPSHGRSEDWGGEAGGNCYNQTGPIEDASYWGPSTSKSMMRVLKEVFSASKTVPITVLNITQLSEYRKDAHTQIYKKQWNPLTPEQLAIPRSYADCVHWCLPGLQDTWNQVLYAKLFFP